MQIRKQRTKSLPFEPDRSTEKGKRNRKRNMKSNYRSSYIRKIGSLSPWKCEEKPYWKKAQH